MSASRMSLADQLKALQDPAPQTLDPEDAYASFDGLKINREGDEGREHYLDVGSSKLKPQISQTLLSDKYGGKKSSRVKIFEDDDDEESDDAQPEFGGDLDEDEEEDEDEDEEEEDDDEDEGEEDEDEDEEDEADDAEQDEEDEPVNRRGESSKASLDPLAHLHASRAKDIEKGQAIRRQQRLFENTLTLRITFQKAVTAAQKIPRGSPQREEDRSARSDALAGLAELNERLFALRSGLLLPGTEAPPSKRRKLSDGSKEAQDDAYWNGSAQDSLSLVDASHHNVTAILSKWSAKIHAATLSGKSKFSTGDGPVSVIDAIEAGLASKREADRSFLDSEDASYRALLREVIETRTGQSSAVDLTHLRKEKKKKREAERGGSKGRKLRYTVHEKAQSFMVPIPLSEAWHDEQIDELFSSLFGGAKVATAPDQTMDAGRGLGGLRMLG